MSSSEFQNFKTTGVKLFNLLSYCTNKQQRGQIIVYAGDHGDSVTAADE
jgi:hypothetical protein